MLQSQARLTRIIQGTNDAVWEWADLSKRKLGGRPFL
jgi:hypothetical protein